MKREVRDTTSGLDAVLGELDGLQFGPIDHDALAEQPSSVHRHVASVGGGPHAAVPSACPEPRPRCAPTQRWIRRAERFNNHAKYTAQRRRLRESAVKMSENARERVVQANRLMMLAHDRYARAESREAEGMTKLKVLSLYWT